MFQDLKPYADYVGQEEASRPAHWEQRSIGSLLTQLSERDRPDLPLLSVARERGIFVRSADDANHNVIPEDLANYKVARRGNLVVNKMKAWQGSMGIAPVHGVVSPAYLVYDLAIRNLAYAHLLLRSKPYVEQYAAASDGVRVGQWDLVDARFRRISVALPPAEEQEAIVTYLVHAHQRINKAIATKRRQIRLLDEQRNVAINAAVSRGLDPGARLADSNSRFVGAVPAHWETLKFSQVATVAQRPGFSSEDLLSVYLGRGVIPYSEGGKRVHAPSLDLSAYQLVEPGDLVMNNQQAWRGSVGVSALRGIVSPAYLVATLSDALIDSYSRYLFAARPLIDQYVVASKGVGDIQRTLHWPYLRNVLVPVPPISEQEEIVAYLERSLATTDRAIAKVVAEVDLLEEFRIRLTADVVTGQVDVRHIAAILPPADLGGAFAGAEGADAEDDDQNFEYDGVEDE